MVKQADLAVLALTSRIVPSQVKPMSAGEFWRLSRGGSIAGLVTMRPEEVASTFGVSRAEANRIASLLDRRTALALAVEQLDHTGTWTITAAGDAYPRRLVQRLGDGAPAVLHGVGDASLLVTDGIGVLGSRDFDDSAADVTRQVAGAVVELGVSLVSGGARGIDQISMNTAFGLGGTVVGVLADSLESAIAKPSTRQGVTRGGICLATPYAPTAGFSPASAMGRNKIVYALSKTVVVVRCDLESGGAWAGASEALSRGYADVASWVGRGSASGNERLVELGARPITSLDDLASVLAAPARPVVAPQQADQLSLPL
jgi:predicted Rossmann fold nucleotide-binding protein DprA/Smf involved in DNA uptake